MLFSSLPLFFALIFGLLYRPIKVFMGSEVLLYFSVISMFFFLVFNIRRFCFSESQLSIFIAFLITSFASFLFLLEARMFAQMQYFLYFYVPFFIFFIFGGLVRSGFRFEMFFLYSFVLSSTFGIAEFLAYYTFPELVIYGTSYLRDVVANNNFYTPYVQFPFLGYSHKPWGVLLDASGSGAFLGVGVAYFYAVMKSRNSVGFWFFVSFLIVSLGCFLSGSKTGYLVAVFGIAFFEVMHSIVYGKKSLKTSLLIVFVPFALVAFIYFFIMYFFNESLLDWYIYAMFIAPVENILKGLVQDFPLILVGLGQEEGYAWIGLGEVDLINSMVRYGILPVVLIVGQLVILSLVRFRYFPDLSTGLFSFFVAMGHYQVAFKYPVSLIFFGMLAVVSFGLDFNARDTVKYKGSF